MLSKILTKLDDSKMVFQRYPLVITMAFIATFCFIFYNNYDYDWGNSPEFKFSYSLSETVFKVGLIAMLGISLSYAMNIASQRYGNPLLFQAITILLLVATYFLTGEVDSPLFYFPYFTLGITCHLLISFIGYLDNRNNDKFWNFNKNIFIEFILSAIFSLVLTLGVLLAIAGVDQLFDIDVGESYLNAWFTIMILGSVLIFLHFTSAGLTKLESNDTFPIVLKFFVLYVLIPLMILYSVILYVYLIQIIINWGLPDGIVTYLVSAFSVFGILAILLVYPLRDTSKHTWIRLFAKIFYYVLIPLICLMAVAIYIRVDAYGVTEPRYYGILLTVWLAGIAIYFILVKDSKVRTIPMSLFLVGLIALVTPGFNATRLSINSQSDRFHTIVDDIELVDNTGKIDFNKAVDREDIKELESIIRFLLERNSEDKIADLFEEDFEINSYKFANKFNNYLDDDVKAEVYASRRNHFSVVDIEEYDYFVQNINSNKTVSEIKVAYDLSITLTKRPSSLKDDKSKLYLIINNSQDSLLLNPLFEDIFQSYYTDKQVPEEEFDISFSHGGYRFLLLVNQLNTYRNTGIYLEGDLFISREE